MPVAEEREDPRGVRLADQAPLTPETPVAPVRRNSKAGFAKATRAIIFAQRMSTTAHDDPVQQKEHRWSRRPNNDATSGGRMDKVRSKVWRAFENPHSSFIAAVIQLFILGCIIVSSLCIHLESMTTLDQYEYLWASLEVLFVVVFSTEYVIRFWAAPMSSYDFILERYNLIDLVAILPFYIVVGAEALEAATGYELAVDIAIIRTLRLMRIFKIAKYSHSTQLLLGSLQRAAPELLFLLGFLALGLVFFGTMMFAVEQGDWNEKLQCHVRAGESDCSPFESIPGTFYWGVTTMTTVGYGDVLPTTRAGTFVACATMFMGILVIALPVTMISNAFMDAHDEVSAECKLQTIQDRAHLNTEDERRLIEGALELRALVADATEALHVIHVTGAELLMAQGKYEKPEDALQHWDQRVALASEVTRKGLVNLKAFCVLLQPKFVA